MGSYNESRKGNMSRETLLVVVEATLSSLGWDYQILETGIFQASFPSQSLVIRRNFEG